MRPFGIPDCFDACSSQDARSFVSRIVTVLLIWHNRNTSLDEMQKQTCGLAPFGSGMAPEVAAIGHNASSGEGAEESDDGRRFGAEWDENRAAHLIRMTDVR